MKSIQMHEAQSPEAFADVAKAAGRRVVAISGYSPYSLVFVPDFNRRGEVSWVDAHDREATEKALEPCATKDWPVVLPRQLVAKLINQAYEAWSLLGSGISPEDREVLEAAYKLLQE